MSINLTISFSHPGAIAHQISYARIDNNNAPVFTTVVPNIASASGTFTIAENIPDGQYQLNALPIYADGRSCQPTISQTPACPGLTSITASISGSVLIVDYLAPSSAPKVRISVAYPNGGSFVANYVNTGNSISIGLPAGVFGNYSVSGQAVCDETSGFYSAPSSSVTVPYNTTISGSIQLGNTLSGVCAAAVSTLYTSGTFVPGSTLYIDAAMTTPVTGFVYALYNGIIYNLNTSTGVLGTDTGQSCAPTVLIQNILSFINISAVIGINGFSYTPSIGVNTQSGSHGAFSISISVNWNGTVPVSPAFSMLLYKNGVLMDCNQFPSGSTSSSFTFAPDSYLATDVIKIITSSGAC